MFSKLMGKTLSTYPSSVMFCLTIHKILNLRLFHSSSLDIFTGYKLENIHSAGESRQVFHIPSSVDNQCKTSCG